MARSTTLLMALGTGVTVGNLYYCQPLLATMAADCNVSARQISWVATLTQIGTACGMLAFVPLGDVMERRGLTTRMCIVAAGAALLTGMAPSLPWLLAASFLLGLTSIIPHLILPFAAHLAADDERGPVVGTVLSGLLIGVLLARTASGLLGAALGWRAIYFLASGMMLVLAWALRRRLPVSPPALRLRYVELLRSIRGLAVEHPLLRPAAMIGALLFGAFNAFWTPLVFRLGAPPYHYGARAAGLLGLVAAFSAAAAPRIGRLVDRRSPRLGVGLGIGIALLGFVVLWSTGAHMAGLIAGVVLLDLGVQAGHISNQTRIYSTFPQARSRANTVYMVSYFIGGALGSALGSNGWARWHWNGVCWVGCSFLFFALLVHATRVHDEVPAAVPAG